MDDTAITNAELENLRLLGLTVAEEATRLKKKLFPVQGGAARKGKKKNIEMQMIVASRRSKKLKRS